MTPEDKRKGLSRRDFMALAGGAAGLAAVSAYHLGVREDSPGSIAELAPEQVTCVEEEADILVIGGGMAALFAAVKGHDAGARVLLVSKGRLGASGQTPFAKGIFAYDSAREQMGLEAFVAAVSTSALGSNNPVFTRQMAAHSKARVEELRGWGFFDSPLYANAFNRPLAERGISVVERVMMTHLIEQDGRISGAAGFSVDEAKLLVIRAKSVVLCTGAGGFKPNGFPICDLTHDGTAMAYRIGAKVTGKEWNDGHFGQTPHAAACYDGWHGMFDRKPGVTGIDVRHDLGVEMNYRAYRAGNPLRGGPPGRTQGEQPGGGPYRPAEFRQPGRRPEPPPGGPRDERRGPPPGMAAGHPVGGASAGMSIHKSEGLVPMDETGASNVPGLWAAGDALGSHMAGGIYTQVGSSLAGSAVQGAVAGEAAAQYCTQRAAADLAPGAREGIVREILAPMNRDTGYGPAWVTQTLQGVMIPNFVMYIKTEKLLSAALAYVEELRDHHLPMLRARDLHELRLAHETANMVLNAEMRLRASLLRQESRCSHYRLDYPQVDNDNWQAWINIYRASDGHMQLEKQPFGSWPRG